MPFPVSNTKRDIKSELKLKPCNVAPTAMSVKYLAHLNSAKSRNRRCPPHLMDFDNKIGTAFDSLSVVVRL